MKKIISRLDIKFNVQIAIAMAISIALGYALDLKYAAATGIVTLATVQSTKKETIKVAGKRLIGYIIMVLLSVLIFNSVGYNVISFGIFLFIFGIINSYMGSVEVLSSNAVMATHFLDSQNTSMALINNENYIFFIGVGVGILVNLLSPVFSVNMRKKTKELDEKFKEIFIFLQDRIMGIYKIDGEETYRELAYVADQIKFKEMKDFILDTKHILYEHTANTLKDDEDYYNGYFDMRYNQLVFVENIWEDSKILKASTEESQLVAAFIDRIVKDYHETNVAEDLLDNATEMMVHFRDKKLPQDRKEFETRAILYIIMQDLITMLKLKRNFVNGLSYEIKKKYWMGV